ncbi:hypothetical protein P872_12285 [Rhodonellum psychrophilum GCM71 = DSM 17998]|uniref:Uncharacterized protein n=2 Tax=Rhodonellum TaxID=336827 RepID=U5BSP5_9BACT|nr:MULTISPECIES: hypothetical protein [Rhodonellum]ERM80544.1 hypothetical protein P872_12285 [Rhodonellum psychrophilum GCM71 = DSM 17998]SDZ48643.1 hypothetical protein SAMN05444412_11711 [Rhodonellum ikkaensis]
MLENQDSKDLKHLSGTPTSPHQGGDHKSNEPEKNSWWSLQNILVKVITVVLGIAALFIVTEVLDQIERMLYELYKISIWVFAVIVVITIIISLFKKD